MAFNIKHGLKTAEKNEIRTPNRNRFPKPLSVSVTSVIVVKSAAPSWHFVLRVIEEQGHEM